MNNELYTLAQSVAAIPAGTEADHPRMLAAIGRLETFLRNAPGRAKFAGVTPETVAAEIVSRDAIWSIVERLFAAPFIDTAATITDETFIQGSAKKKTVVIVLDPLEAEVLQVLGPNLRLSTNEIYARVKRGDLIKSWKRNAILVALEKKKLIHRPAGKRTGYEATDLGRAAIDSFRKNAETELSRN